MDFHLIINITECQIRIVSELIWHLYLFNKLAAHRCTMDQLEKVTAYKYIYIHYCKHGDFTGGRGGGGGGVKLLQAVMQLFCCLQQYWVFYLKKNSSSHKDAETNCNYSIRTILRMKNVQVKVNVT